MKITNFKLGIGIPNTWTHVPSSFFDSFIQMDRPDFKYIPAKNGPINELRNYIVDKALQLGCSHLLMMDVDQQYPQDTITKLLSHNLPVVHAMVHRRYPPFDSLIFEGTLNNYSVKTDFEYGDLVKADACGTGCVLYQTKVFTDIKAPWFEFVANPDKEKGGVVGEDIWFCEKLKDAGYSIYVDTSLDIVHLGMFGIDKSFSHLYQALVKKQLELNSTQEA